MSTAFQGAKIETLLFWVLPVVWGGTNELSCVPDFSNPRSLFRGTVDGDLDFSSGKVTSDDVIGKYGDCEMVFWQGEPWTDVNGLESYKVLLIDGELAGLCYQSRGIQFNFEDGLVQTIVIFKPVNR